jgi:hypothetical protein
MAKDPKDPKDPKEKQSDYYAMNNYTSNKLGTDLKDKEANSQVAELNSGRKSSTVALPALTNKNNL